MTAPLDRGRLASDEVLAAARQAEPGWRRLSDVLAAILREIERQLVREEAA